MNLASQPHSFFQYQRKTLADLPEAQFESAPNARRRDSNTKITEPGGLVKVRQQLKREGCLAARASRNAGPHDEAIAAVRQAIVVGHAPGYAAGPIAIQALQAIRVAHLVRRTQINSGIAKL